MSDSSPHVFAGALADALAANSVSVDCNHGSWNTAAQTCVCDAGWTTDWSNQDILSSNYVYCNSRASTQSPVDSGSGTTHFSKNTVIAIVVICVVVVVGACAVIAFCCYRCLRRRSAERAGARDAVKAAEAQMRQLQAESALAARQQQQQQLHQQMVWAAEVEEAEQRHRAAMMDRYMSLSTPSQQHPYASPYSSPRCPAATMGGAFSQPYAAPMKSDYDVRVHPDAAAFADEAERWPAKEPIEQAYSRYYPRAPTPTADSYAAYSEVHPPHYTARDGPADEYGLLMYSPRQSPRHGYGCPPY